MSFIRVKKINGNEYAYLVENKWYKRGFKGKGKGPRQKVGKYLGKAYYFNKGQDIDFFTFKKIENLEEYLKNNAREKIIRELVEWEVFRHNIDKSRFTIDLSDKKITANNKEVSLKMNEGFLNSFTLSRLFNMRSNEGYYLAKCFVEAGIEIPKEVFAGLFGR